MVLFKGVCNFVNWRAFSVSLLLLLFISLLWEATLGVPYMWWAYRPEQMLGFPLVAWGGTPVEELLLWTLAGWATVIFYETFRVIFYMERPKVRHAMLGFRADLEGTKASET